jgi:S1-C subfamily serine protease
MPEQTNPSPKPTFRERLQQLRKRAKGAVGFASGVAAALVALLLYNAVVPGTRPLTPRDVGQIAVQVMASATVPPAYSAGVYRVIQPSLVFIETENDSANEDEKNGVGSGVVVSDKGDILTSLHVISGATSIKLTFADGTETGAVVVAEQPENDIAVLRPTSQPPLLVPAVLGNPGGVRVGDEAYVVGNPLGLYSSMSAGVISALNRTFQPEGQEVQLKNLIQIDAAVNPGNSGGPLLNRNGEVIGIVTALVNPTGQDVFIGIGFAVPINVAGGAAGLAPY